MARRSKNSFHSPYCKAPHRYSAEYNRWRDAIAKGHAALAKEADRLWRQRFCIRVSFEPEDDYLPAHM